MGVDDGMGVGEGTGEVLSLSEQLKKYKQNHTNIKGILRIINPNFLFILSCFQTGNIFYLNFYNTHPVSFADTPLFRGEF